MAKIQIIIGIISVLLLIVVFELIRRGRLKEEYSLLWLLSAIVILIFSIFPNLLLDIIAKAMGMYYLTALFVISFLFLLLIVLHFSTVISHLSENNKMLTQELSILEYRFNELDKKFHQLNSKKEENEIL